MMKANEKIPVITIDGPSGSGKGTLCQILARKLNWHLLDSGAIYRVLAFAAFQANIPLMQDDLLVQIAGDMKLQFKPQSDNTLKVLLNNQDVSKEIRTEANGQRASVVSTSAQVREALLQKQRDFRQFPGLVTDGRDMGTTVFPNAGLKLFLSASAEERAKRRYEQLINQGINANLAQVLDELLVRDQRDTARSASPLQVAADAISIDTTKLSIEQVVEQVMGLAKARFT
ncbi:MAG: cytidylate kinase [Legionellales bacterium]|nr:cytidylate kinase [Legionellales bacterium]